MVKLGTMGYASDEVRLCFSDMVISLREHRTHATKMHYHERAFTSKTAINHSASNHFAVHYNLLAFVWLNFNHIVISLLFTKSLYKPQVYWLSL